MIPGSRVSNANCHGAVVNGSGMSVSRNASGRVLNDVITVQANGTNISTAYEMRRTYAIVRRSPRVRSPTGPGGTGAGAARGASWDTTAVSEPSPSAPTVTLPSGRSEGSRGGPDVGGLRITRPACCRTGGAGPT